MIATVLYDILNEGWPLEPFVLLLGLLWLAVIFFRNGWGFKRTAKSRRWGEGLAVLLVLAAGGAGLGNMLYQRYRCLSWASGGHFQVVEGEVKSFSETRNDDFFIVGGVQFHIAGSDLTRGALGQRSREGGPIRPGMKVKIAHHDGRILKVERLESRQVRGRNGNEEPRPEPNTTVAARGTEAG
jgi:hypothetical protein